MAGIEGTVGTSTVAAALHGRDGGRCERGADVVVCGQRVGSLRAVGALELPRSGPRPVLAVALTPSAPVPPVSRMRALDARFGAVVLVPFVDTWQGGPPALDEAASVLAHPVEHLPHALRAYAAAMRSIAGAVLRSGQLHRPTPPAARPRAMTLWHGLVVATEQPAPARPALVAVPTPPRLRRADAPAPDDDELAETPARAQHPPADRAG